MSKGVPVMRMAAPGADRGEAADRKTLWPEEVMNVRVLEGRPRPPRG